jgi:N-acetylglucosaminyl-diphospho-decaprenol L-rhamnosyltransferase
MDLSIVIVNWNTRDWLQGCLNSVIEELLSQPDLEAEIIVVDNNSNDGSVEMVESEFPQARRIENSENLGFAKANNQALHIAKGRLLLFLNPDTKVEFSAFREMIDYLDQHPGTGAVGPQILNPDRTLQVSAFRFPTLFREFWRLFHLDAIYPLSIYPESYFHRRTSQPADVLLGACFLLRRDVLDRIGLFDEQFFVYSEEVDLCLRIHKAGWENRWLPEAIVIHYGGKSTQQVSDEMFLELNRNKTLFFRKHYGKTSARIYKTLLLVVSASRILPCKILKMFGFSGKLVRSGVDHQYSLLLKELANF